MPNRRIARLALTVAVGMAVGMTALSGCGGDSDDEGAAADTSPPPAASTPATTPEARTATASAGALTAAGSTLQIGEAATIAYEDAGKHLKSNITVAAKKIETGSIDDFKNITLDAEQKTATPYYVEVSVENVGTGNLTGTDPASYIDAVDDRGQRQNEVIFFGDFERCDGRTPRASSPASPTTPA